MLGNLLSDLPPGIFKELLQLDFRGLYTVYSIYYIYIFIPCFLPLFVPNIHLTIKEHMILISFGFVLVQVFTVLFVHF